MHVDDLLYWGQSVACRVIGSERKRPGPTIALLRSSVVKWDIIHNMMRSCYQFGVDLSWREPLLVALPLLRC